MKTIETIAHVGEDRRLTVRLPAEIPPGDHRVVVVIEEATASPRPFRVEDLPRHDIAWPFAPDETFRRRGSLPR